VEFENLLIDENDDLKPKSLDEDNLESNTQMKMTLGNAKDLLMVNKMANVFRQGML